MVYKAPGSFSALLLQLITQMILRILGIESYTYQDLCVISTFHQRIPINDTPADKRIFRKRILGACFTVQLSLRAVSYV